MIKKFCDFILNSEKGKIVLQSVLVGLLSGLVAVLFRLAIENLFSFVLSITHNSGRVYLLLVIACFGSFIAGLAVFKLAPETKGSGIPFVKAVLQKSGAVIRVRTVFVKFFAGVFSIGTGMSLGREGPSIQLGAGTGAFVSKLFGLKNINKDTLIAAGAGSAVAATFNAPLAGTIFVIEELLNRFSSSLLFPCLVATVTAATVAELILGNKVIFDCNVPGAVMNPENLVVYVCLGVLAGIFGVLFSKTIFFFNSFYAKLNNIPDFIKPVIAAFIIGIIGIFLPYVLSGGNNVVEMLFDNHFSIYLVIIIFIVKFFVTPLCFGSGAAGGIFLPMLMIGAFLGYITGYIALKTGFDVNPATTGVIGMAAFLSAVARTPITATVMVFEMTAGYDSVLPIMLVSAISDITAEKFGQVPIYSKLLINSYKEKSGNNNSEEKTVENCMTRKVKAFFAEDNVKYVFEFMQSEKHNAYPVVDAKNRLLGLITKADLEDIRLNSEGELTPVGRIMNTNPLRVYKTDDLYTCYYKLHNANTEWAVVVNKKCELEGIITRADILKNIKF